MKHLNSTHKDVARKNIVPKEQWIDHYKQLLYNSEIDLIDIEEVELKSRKVPGLDGTNLEMIKYGGAFLKFRMLHLYNMRWRQY